MEKIRIQKFLSEAGVASRRGAERDIEQGQVTVNGRPCQLGAKVDPAHDVVVYKGKRVGKISQRKVYIMLHKPRGYITTLSDEFDRKCVSQLVEDVGVRVYPIGRLDKDSEGLLLMTNDGDFANKLMHPKGGISKIYLARIKGHVTSDALRTLTSPLELDGYRIKPVKVDVIENDDNTALLRFELFEGRNRQIRKMCEAAELNLSRLVRVAEGDIALGDLAVGKWKYLTKAQIEYLKNKVESNA